MRFLGQPNLIQLVAEIYKLFKKKQIIIFIYMKFFYMDKFTRQDTTNYFLRRALMINVIRTGGQRGEVILQYAASYHPPKTDEAFPGVLSESTGIVAFDEDQSMDFVPRIFRFLIILKLRKLSFSAN